MTLRMWVLLGVFVTLLTACNTKERSKEDCHQECRRRHMAYDVTQEQVEAACAKECGPL